MRQKTTAEKTASELLRKRVEEHSVISLVGHVRPDGDCLTSALALSSVLQRLYPGKTFRVFMRGYSPAFRVLPYESTTLEYKGEDTDLLIMLDGNASEDRVGEGAPLLRKAKAVLDIDHHITNPKTGETILFPDASSTAELLVRIWPAEEFSKEEALILYTGIAHDTGVFRYSNVTPDTMEAASTLLKTGIQPNSVIDATFFEKSYHQLQVRSKAVMESIRLLDGRVIFSKLTNKDMKFYGVTPSDLDGIVEALRDTEGVECSIFLYEMVTQCFKVSLRSKSVVDVSRVASVFGGGGHVRAAGCSMHGTVHDIVNNLTREIVKDLGEDE